MSLSNLAHILRSSLVTAQRAHLLGNANPTNVTNRSAILIQPIRWSTSFFMRHTADQIWKGVTSVSPAGFKRGRGKGTGKKRIKDLNRGQIIGMGTKRMLWPGLTSPIFRGREVITRKELPPDTKYEERIKELRDRMETRTRAKLHPLERGWSGGKMHGRSIGSELPGFDSKVLLTKPSITMSGVFGRVRNIKTIVVTGNGQGLAGFSIAIAKDNRTSLKRARTQAQLRLIYVPIFEEHTVIHDFYSKFGSSEVFIFKRPRGYGLEGHRVIKTICQMIGIKDLTAIVEGSARNTWNLTRAFFMGLLSQKNFQEMADEKRLHLVEFRHDRDLYPLVVASPSDGVVRKLSEIKSDENLDFQMYLHDGHVIHTKPPPTPHYLNTFGYEIYKRKIDYVKNRNKVRVQLIAKYGGLESFLTIREKERLAKLREEFFKKSAAEAAEEMTKKGEEAEEGNPQTTDEKTV